MMPIASLKSEVTSPDLHPGPVRNPSDRFDFDPAPSRAPCIGGAMSLLSDTKTFCCELQ